jgi:uncharacterized membrane protein YecN with MAPEG domain
MGVPIVALYGGLNAIFNVFLAIRVSGARRRSKTSLGLGTDEGLLHANRAHGNNAEFVPLALVLLLIAELQGGSSNALHALGGSLFVARILHWIGISRPAPNIPRVVGTTVTYLIIIGTAAYAIVLRSGKV